jgi:hypothetical protein
MKDLEHKQEKIIVYCDNQSVLYITGNLVFHSRIKHINVQYCFVHEVVEDRSVCFQKIHNQKNLVDALSKPVNSDKYIWCRSSYGLADS